MASPFVLVTGGAKNIGAGICKRLSEDGFTVISADIADPEHDYLKDFFRLDFANPMHTRKVLSEITKKYSITNLVNNVGVVAPSSIENTSIEEFNQVININSLSALVASQVIVPEMKAQKYGRIVSIASRVVLGKELRTAYSASKGAILAMTRTWALELAEHGITVNCIGPGPISTSAFWYNNPPNQQRTKSIINNVPAKRLGLVTDVAHAVSFFMDKRSSFITGQMLYVCGGLTVGLAKT